MRILALILLVFQSAHALSPEEIRAAIKAQASNRHPDPPGDFWKNLGPEALPVLKKMIEEDLGNVERTWLIEGLGHFNDPEVGRILESRIKLSENDVFTKKLLASLIHSQGDQSLDFVEPYLSSPSPHIRIAVARGIRAHMKSDRARERLERYLAVEKESWIRDRIAKVETDKDRGGPTRRVRILATGETGGPSEALAEPLPEKDWAGEWKGVYLMPGGSGSAKGFLKKEKEGWRMELILPKKKRIELKASEAEVQYFQTDHYHWIRVRGRKTDTVFTGNRKTN
ncbi:MAG: hypothetical protein KGP28_05990 [Bdellovibrionales bacterium]|nr:hypothetical protein [Bdellovibrionales bacterium]